MEVKRKLLNVYCLEGLPCYLSLSNIQMILQIPHHDVYSLIKTGSLRVVKIMRKPYVTRDEFLEWLDNQQYIN